jgi:hypothetical protein
LGERLLCKQEVVGSIPSGSTRCLRERRGVPKDEGCGGCKTDALAGDPRRYKLLPTGDGWRGLIFDIVKKGFDFPCHGFGRVL